MLLCSGLAQRAAPGSMAALSAGRELGGRECPCPHCPCGPEKQSFTSTFQSFFVSRQHYSTIHSFTHCTYFFAYFLICSFIHSLYLVTSNCTIRPMLGIEVRHDRVQGIDKVAVQQSLPSIPSSPSRLLHKPMRPDRSSRALLQGKPSDAQEHILSANGQLTTLGPRELTTLFRGVVINAQDFAFQAPAHWRHTDLLFPS